MKNFSPYMRYSQFQQLDVSRRHFLVLTAGSVAGVATSSLSLPALASEGEDEHEVAAAPRPIPGGTLISPPVITPPAVFVHHFGFAAAVIPFHDPSQITDFRGFVANCRVTGRGTGTEADGTRTRLAYQVDNGFMQGNFVGLDGHHHIGTFGFT